MATMSAGSNHARGAAIAAIIGAATAWTSDHALLGQARCVDVPLDLYKTNRDQFVHRCIAEHLSDLRHVNAVDGDAMRDDLVIPPALTLQMAAP